MVMGQCHYNLISKNKLETLDYSDEIVSNLIYFNPFGHADYSGPALCVGNIISDNYLKAFCNGVMSIVLQLTYEIILIQLYSIILLFGAVMELMLLVIILQHIITVL